MSKCFREINKNHEPSFRFKTMVLARVFRKQYLDMQSMRCFISYLGCITYISNGAYRSLNIEIETADTTYWTIRSIRGNYGKRLLSLWARRNLWNHLAHSPDCSLDTFKPSQVSSILSHLPPCKKNPVSPPEKSPKFYNLWQYLPRNHINWMTP